MLLFILYFLTPIAYAVDVNTYIPKNAIPLLPLVYQEQQKIFKAYPFPNYFPALIEQESCISLTHSKCWNPSSKLSTKRELGVGFFQITKAYTSSGSVRFDTLAELRRKYRETLNELTWNNIHLKPELQISAGVLLVKDIYSSLYNISDPYERALMADAAYNGGLSHLQKERVECGLKSSCDPQRWFNNVESIKSIKSQKFLYGRRSAWDINREHPRLIFKVRMPKYLAYYEKRGWINNSIAIKAIDNKVVIKKDTKRVLLKNRK